jgi:bacterioferritin
MSAKDRHKEKLRVIPIADRAQANVATVRELNAVLATEITCVLRYRSHAARCTGILGSIVRSHFIEHAKQEAAHAKLVSERIVDLGGDPEYDPQKIIELSHVKFVTSNNVAEMVRQNLQAERVAIERYRELILMIGNQDAPTRAILEQILAQEEEHARDMVELISDPALENLSYDPESAD